MTEEAVRRRIRDRTHQVYIEGTLQQTAQRIVELIAEHGSDAEFSIKVDQDYGYYGDDGCSCTAISEITTYRDETALEVERRLKKAEKAKLAAEKAKKTKAEAKKKKEEAELKLFFELAKKFGKQIS